MFWEMFVLRSLKGPQNVIQPQNVKQCYVLRNPHLRFRSYAVEIIITFCVTFCEMLRFAALQFQCLSLGLRIYAIQHIIDLQ